MQSSRYWRRKGLCYTHVSSVGFAARILPAGIIFSSESISIFLAPLAEPACEEDSLLVLLGFLASTVAQELVWVFGRYRKIENRALSGLPISLERLAPAAGMLANLARQGVLSCKRLAAFDETTLLFEAADAIVDGDLSGRSRGHVATALSEVLTSIDACVQTLLGIADGELTAERRAALVPRFATERIAQSKQARAADAVMWAVGRAFGRWRQGQLPKEQESAADAFFESLPKSPPALRRDGGPARDVLVDDEGHEADISSLIAAALTAAGGESLIERVTSELGLGELRRWISERLFGHHLSRYSAFKRRAPIYWQLSTASSGYSVWLYADRVTKDTLSKVQNDYVTPKVRLEERRLEGMRREAGGGSKASDRKALATQEGRVEELRTFLEEIKRATPLWMPDINDGVALTMAPLWKLVPQHRAWQRELKAAWDALDEGRYDWSRVAMYLWPGRVVPRCTTDRSLAIAHGLEDAFWEQGGNGEWLPRREPPRTVKELVDERASPAVKAGLAEFRGSMASSGRETPGEKGERA